MTDKTKKASALFLDGQNCAQAIFCSFCEDYGIDRETALKLAGGFGRGLRSGEVCGAVAGAVMIIGLKHGGSREICNTKTVEFINAFKSENGDIVCRELLKRDLKTPAGKEDAQTDKTHRPKCLSLIVSAAEILEKLEY